MWTLYQTPQYALTLYNTAHFDIKQTAPSSSTYFLINYSIQVNGISIIINKYETTCDIYSNLYNDIYSWYSTYFTLLTTKLRFRMFNISHFPLLKGLKRAKSPLTPWAFRFPIFKLIIKLLCGAVESVVGKVGHIGVSSVNNEVYF